MILDEEYKELEKCIGFLVQIIFSQKESYFSRLMCLSKTEDDRIVLYLTNGLGTAIVTKNSDEYNQYAITILSQKVRNKGLYTSNIKIDKNESKITLFSM